MSSDRKATFRLKGKFPEQLTIERLAQYLRQLNQLVGASEKVRVSRIGRGSVLMSMQIDPDYYGEMVVRVSGATNPTFADAGAQKAAAQLQEMITADRVRSAEFVANGTPLLKLKGFTADSGESLGPFSQPYAARGRLVGLEGKDRTKHARIAEFGTDREIAGEITDNDLARKLREHLWGDVIEFVGTGRLFRTREGLWNLRAFRIESYREVDDASPSRVVASLRLALGEPGNIDPVGAIRKLRG